MTEKKKPRRAARVTRWIETVAAWAEVPRPVDGRHVRLIGDPNLEERIAAAQAIACHRVKRELTLGRLTPITDLELRLVDGWPSEPDRRIVLVDVRAIRLTHPNPFPRFSLFRKAHR